MKRFFIVNVNKFQIVGRNDDCELHIGDEFTKLVFYKTRSYPDGYNQKPEVEETKQINYKITSIIAYDRELEFLGEGMTGLLVLEGEGELKQGWVLE